MLNPIYINGLYKLKKYFSERNKCKTGNRLLSCGKHLDYRFFDAEKLECCYRVSIALKTFQRKLPSQNSSQKGKLKKGQEKEVTRS
jgi:hypothetical protein